MPYSVYSCHSNQLIVDQVTLVPVGTIFTPPQKNEMDNDAFRALELMRQGVDFMQMPAQQKRDDHALGLHMYKAEREKLERLYGL